MTERSLEVTYRKGRAFAAYLHLAHATSERSAKMVPSLGGVLVIDFGTTGRALGIEITAPGSVSLERFNQVLVGLGETALTQRDFEPLLLG